MGGNRKKYALMAACAVIVSAPVSHAQDLSQFFSSYIAFGDSLTDDGKFNNTPFAPGLPSLSEALAHAVELHLRGGAASRGC